MENIQKLIEKISATERYFELSFAPRDKGERWGIKVYDAPYRVGGYFYAYSESPDDSARKILDDLREAGI